MPSPCPGCGSENPPTAKFCSECGGRLGSQPTGPTQEPQFHAAVPSSYTPKHLADKILASKSALEGERKGVTVMFVDVCGFTTISEKLDPEDVHAIMDRAFEIMLEAVHRYEGTINQFLGDGIMALFGAPIAHEDHPHRTLSAALAIRQGLTPLQDDVRRQYGIEFQVRMGVNTGLVVVGAIGRDLRMDYTAVGDTTNLTARLMSLAQPGQIVVSRRTQHLRERFFKFQDLGQFQVKGKSEPVHAYALIDEIRGRTRLEVSKERGLTPLVGREGEVAQLVDAYRRAADGRGSVVLVSGEPGVGKSRLLYELLREVETAGGLELEATCVAYGRTMAYRPILELVRRYLGLLEEMGSDEVRWRTEKGLTMLGVDGDEPALLLAHFLGVPAPEAFLARTSGAELKARTFAVLCDLLVRASDETPLVVIVENVHWIDATSDEFLAKLATLVPDHRILLVLSTRPGTATSLIEERAAIRLTLGGLDAGGLRKMIVSLTGADVVSESLFGMLVDKSAGNPLYVEEIVRQLQETGGLAVVDAEARLGSADVVVPATIHDIIAARIDRLADPLKRTLQGAAIIGRRFGVSLLSRVLEIPPTAVSSHLKELHRADFIFPAWDDPELMYSFKHALTQDVVYGGVLERRRRQYHAASAFGLEELYAGNVDPVVELIAYHFRRGQIWDRAATYLRQAAIKAQSISAHREAMASLEEALEALRHLPETEDRRKQEIDVRLELRGSLYPLGEFDKMLSYLREAETLANGISDSRRLGLVSLQIAEYFRQTGRFAEARTLAEQGLALGDKLQDRPLQLYASHFLGLACNTLGDYRRACDVLRTVVQSPPIEWRRGAFSGTVIVSWAGFQAITLAWFARSLAERGEFEESMEAGRRAVALAEEIGNPYTVAAACIGLGYSALVKTDLDAATSTLERACRIAREANLTLLRPQATRLLGGTYALAGRIDEGVALVQAAADEVESRRLLMQHATVLAALGQAYVVADRIEEAVTSAQRAVALARERGQRGDEATALYVAGEALARRSTAEATQQFVPAIALAGQLGMRPLLARAHLGLGRVHVRMGDRDRAEDHLLAATRLSIEMDMPLLVRRALTSLSELGGALIVARDRKDLYDYLSRALASGGSIDVVLETPGAAPRIDDERRREHIGTMLRSHGFSLASG